MIHQDMSHTECVYMHTAFICKHFKSSHQELDPPQYSRIQWSQKQASIICQLTFSDLLKWDTVSKSTKKNSYKHPKSDNLTFTRWDSIRTTNTSHQPPSESKGIFLIVPTNCEEMSPPGGQNWNSSGWIILICACIILGQAAETRKAFISHGAIVFIKASQCQSRLCFIKCEHTVIMRENIKHFSMSRLPSHGRN